MGLMSPSSKGGCRDQWVDKDSERGASQERGQEMSALWPAKVSTKLYHLRKVERISNDSGH